MNDILYAMKKCALLRTARESIVALAEDFFLTICKKAACLIFTGRPLWRRGAWKIANLEIFHEIPFAITRRRC